MAKLLPLIVDRALYAPILEFSFSCLLLLLRMASLGE